MICFIYSLITCSVKDLKIQIQQWRRQGGARRGGCPPPNVEKDGPRNSSKFDEKIGMGVGIHLRCEKIINNKYF